jgi:hypothetical protein
MAGAEVGGGGADEPAGDELERGGGGPPAVDVQSHARTHLENIYERLHVSSRTAAVTRAFPHRAA